MYRENELRIFWMTGEEIQGMAAQRQESLRAGIAKLEGELAGADGHKANYIKVHVRDLREQIDGLEFVKAHVKLGAHELTPDELNTIRDRLSPIDPETIQVRMREEIYEGASKAINAVEVGYPRRRLW